MGTSAPPAGERVELEIHEHHGPRWRKTDIGPTPAAAVSASRTILLGDARALGGWSIRETTGAAGAVFRVREANANGEVVASANLAANESIRDDFGPAGIGVDTGKLYLQVLSGSVEGVIYWR